MTEQPFQGQTVVQQWHDVRLTKSHLTDGSVVYAVWLKEYEFPCATLNDAEDCYGYFRLACKASMDYRK